MHLRFMAVAFVLLLAGALDAQTSANISATVTQNETQRYLLEVSPWANSVQVSLTTTSAAGLDIELYDLEHMLEAPSSMWLWWDWDYTLGAGTALVELALPARAGTTQLLLVVAVADDDDDSSYAGTASVTGGTVAVLDFESRNFGTVWGVEEFFGRQVNISQGFNGIGTKYVDFELDFGVGPQTATFSVRIDANNVSAHRLMDASTGTPVVAHTVNAPLGFLDHDGYTFTTAAYSGVVRFLLEVDTTGDVGFVDYVLVLAQDTVFVSQSAPSVGSSVEVNETLSQGRFHTYLFEVDHGATAQEVDVVIELSSSSQVGVIVELMELDQFAVFDYPAANMGFVAGSGSVTMTYRLPIRTGVHQLMLIVSSYQFSPSAPYTVKVGVSAGGVAQAGFRSLPYQLSGARVHFGRVIEFQRQNSDVISLDFELDFGETAKSTTFYVQAWSWDGDEFRMFDLSSGTPVAVRATPGVFGLLFDEFAHTTPDYSGVVKFRLQTTTASGAGPVFYTVVIGSDVKLVSPGGGGGGGGKKSDDGCAVAAGTAPWGLLGLAVPAMWALRRRRIA